MTTASISSQNRQAAEQASDTSRRSKPAEKDPPPRESSDRFDKLMERNADKAALQQGRGQEGKSEGMARADQSGDLAAHQRATGDDGQHVAALRDQAGRQQQGQQDQQGDTGKQTTMTGEMAGLLHAHQVVQQATSNPAAASQVAAFNPQAFSEMVEKHVKQLAVNQDNARDGQVLLRMDDRTLPGTSLLLSRNAHGGWTLKADTTSRDSYNAISRAIPSLSRRFSEAGLGQIEVDSEFNG